MNARDVTEEAVTLAARIPVGLMAALRDRAREEDRSLSSVVRQALVSHLTVPATKEIIR